MNKRIGIINCYSDEPIEAPSANYFKQFIADAEVIKLCHGERISDIGKYDGYIISGSRSNHLEDKNWIEELKNTIKNIFENNIPCLAVCFGHQVVAKLFGGKTVSCDRGEEGFCDVPTKLDEVSIKLFQNMPNPAKIYQSHNDAVIAEPPDSINVIVNEKCVQYFQIGSIQSIQSHPEISVTNAIAIAQREDQNIKTILNGVNEENIQSHLVLENFSRLVESTKK